jgi:Ni/Co efflux regulator RcnB
MRKLIVMSLLAAAAIPAAASAQSRQEIRRDRQEVQDQRQDLHEARRYGDRSDIREERRDLREARQELREDRADRNRNRYAAPYRSWSYSRIGAGHQLRPTFYSSRYLVSDYSRRGLRQPGRFQRWIRYGDDLVLVNVRNGRVIQVLHNRY